MSEIQQAFEDYAISRHRNVHRRGGFYVDIHAELDWKIWRAAYEAGEIAMREKAAKKAVELADAADDTIDGGLASSVLRLCAQKIGALAISGAEESTPAELP